MTLRETAGLDLREHSPLESRRLWSPPDMQEFYLPQLLELSKELGRLADYYGSVEPDKTLDKETQKKNGKMFRNDTQTFLRLELRMCSAHAERIADSMDKPMLELAQMMTELFTRMSDECSLRKFMSLSIKDAEFVFPANPLFGQEVENKFPSAAFEIDEGGKCLGLGRYTACVFHLMRVMEIAINATGACLGIAPPVKDFERNWGEILRKIKEEMGRRNGMNPKVWADQKGREFFADTYASLDAVRVAWRNTTMHVENKYSPDEAEHIFGAVRGFMKKIASRFDEKGLPAA